MLMESLVDEAWSVIEPNLAGLSDEEYFWEPSDGCLGVRDRGTTNPASVWGSGDWVVEHSLPNGAEPQGSTIGWKLLHAYDCFVDYVSKAFGRGPVDWNSHVIPHTAAEAVQTMTTAVDELRTLLETSTDEVLLARGEDLAPDSDLTGGDPRPPWVLLNKALLEWIHHSAEVGVLRQSYRAEHSP